jgi:2-polyprenyl-6-methoxyphenol hydroxylase-like FAD-dependent oxidoreductase
VKWSCRLRRAEEVEGLVNLYFDHGVESGFDLVVGADGCWSKIRPLLSDSTPYYSGISGYQWSLPNAKKNYPKLYKLVNRGSTFVFSDSKSIMAQQLGDESLAISAWLVQPEDWQETADFDVNDVASVKSAYLKIFHDWDPLLKAFIEEMDGTNLATRSLYMLPIGHQWTNKHGITLIGDSAHLMTPFAGEGVNMAMKDALDLAEVLISASVKSFEDVTNQIAKFEQSMFKRGKVVQQLTYDQMEAMYFVPGAPHTTIGGYVSRAVTDELNPIIGYLVSGLVHTVFFFWKLFGFGKGLSESIRKEP